MSGMQLISTIGGSDIVYPAGDVAAFGKGSPMPSSSPVSSAYRIVPGLSNTSSLSLDDIAEVRRAGEPSPMAQRAISAVTTTIAKEMGYSVSQTGTLIPSSDAARYGDLVDPTMPARSARDPDEWKSTSYDSPGVG